MKVVFVFVCLLGSIQAITLGEFLSLRYQAAKILNPESSAEATAHNSSEHLSYDEKVEHLTTGIAKSFFNDATKLITVPDRSDLGFRYKQIAERIPVDFMILIDSSARVGSTNFESACQLAHDWVDILEENNFVENDKFRVSFLTFSEPDRVSRELLFSPNQNKSVVLEQIINSDFHNGSVSSTDIALWTAELIFERLGRAEATKVLLLITDGFSTHQTIFGSLWPAARLKVKHNVKLFVLSIGEEINHRELRALASDPDERYFFEVESYQMIEDVLAAIKPSS